MKGCSSNSSSDTNNRSLPNKLSPQQLVVPSFNKAHVCPFPAVMPTTSLSADTSVGVKLVTVCPFPNSPALQHYAQRGGLSTAECYGVVDTAAAHQCIAWD